MYYAGVETGGTSICAAIAKDPDITQLLAREVFTTTTPQETLPQVANWLKNQQEKFPFVSIGIASFGPVDLDPSSKTFGYITTTPKPGWAFTPVLQAFDCFDCPKGFDTDVNAPAVSEATIGKHDKKSSRKISSCAYITVGTGVGVGIYVDGNSVHGLVHPEVGHLLVPRAPGDELHKSTCPFHAECVEGFVSTGSLAARLGIDAADLPKVPDDHPVWQIVGHYLAVLCANLVLTVSPSVIVLGGGVMNRECLYAIVRSKTLDLLNGYINSPLLTKGGIDDYIVRSQFGTQAGIVGALELGRIAYQKNLKK